jgi:cyclopropane-fatty-acyl-phospholipid synthase
MELDGDIVGLLRIALHAAPADLRFLGLAGWSAVLRAARDLGALGPPLRPPPQVVLPRGRRHSARRDAAAVTHHYDVGNEFYRLLLGPTMAYSCARFTDERTRLDAAQTAKFDLVCRKLGLPERPGARLLDVGCGWGSMAIHAADCYGAEVVGVTLSGEQADLARRRVAEAGLSGRVEIRVQDYRDVPDADFDAISSIGMFEHVGRARQAEYFAGLRGRLRPGGRLLNHAISAPGSSRMSRRSFMYRYVFPDGELIDVGEAILAMERAGFEVRDVESLREHYGRTLQAWVANLEEHWDEAVDLVGEARARIWRIYMAGSANRFEQGNIGVHQVLGVVADADGRCFMPPTRAGWETPGAVR